jgi:hypothetical protein
LESLLLIVRFLFTQ